MQPITGKTKLLGVLGNPIEHSLSPAMQNAALAHLNLDYVYLPFRVELPSLEAAIAGFEAIHLVGFNVTIPHKQSILPYLASVSPVARAVGAVNAVWRTEIGWKGTNTDVTGFIAPLKALQRTWQQVTPVILGNGGAARAVVAGCAELGCTEIHVVGRNEGKLLEFKESWKETPLYSAVKVHPWANLSVLIPHTDLLVNTTPIGMYPEVNQSPVSDADMARLRSSAIAYDLIYNPGQTQFLQQAQRQGAKVFNGVEMLVQQGAAALEIWIQQPAPVEVMRQALLKQLNI